MSTTKSRFAPRYPVAAPSGAASGPTVEQALDRGAAVMFRIRRRRDQRGVGYHHLLAFTGRFECIEFDYADRAADQAIRTALIALLLETYPHIDFSRDHDVYVLTGEVRRSPEDNEPGWLPDEDQTFGGGPAACLPTHEPIGAAAA